MHFRIPAQEELLAALGRAWWNGLYLGGQMIDVAAALGVIAPLNHLTLGQLRREMLTAVPNAGLSGPDRDRVRRWLDDLAEVIDKRNDLGHAQPYTVGPD